MPQFEFVEYTADPDTHVARITLNRPDRLNALNDQMQREFTDAIASAESDHGVRVVIVTGAGRAFCAGGDLNDLGGSSDGTGAGWTSGNADEVRRSFRSAQAMILGVQRCEKPVIAMVNGVATGAGLDLACAPATSAPAPRDPDSCRLTYVSGCSPDSAERGYILERWGVLGAPRRCFSPEISWSR